MSIIEILFAILGIAAIYIAYQAHHNGVTFAAQAKTDLANAQAKAASDVAQAKAEATKLSHDLETRVVALETKLGLINPPAAAPAAAVVPGS